MTMLKKFPDGRQGEHVDIETGMARARAADIKQIGPQALALHPHE